MNRMNRGARAYTIVELLMSLSVLAIGVAGVIAMQKVTLTTNRYAKDLSVATRVAEAWADQLAVDANLWTTKSGRANTEWLKVADPSKVIDWHIPAHSLTRNFGAAFGPQGSPVNAGVTPALAHFCAHLRFTFLHQETTPRPGYGLIRAQIRVFWLRNEVTTNLPSLLYGNTCAADDATLKANMDQFHLVYLTTSVAQMPEASP